MFTNFIINIWNKGYFIQFKLREYKKINKAEKSILKIITKEGIFDGDTYKYIPITVSNEYKVYNLKPNLNPCHILRAL